MQGLPSARTIVAQPVSRLRAVATTGREPVHGARSAAPGRSRVGGPVRLSMIAPMLVAIDVGNSAAKLALLSAGRVIALRRAPTRLHGVSDELDALLAAAAGRHGAAQVAVRGLAIVSVVPGWVDAAHDLGRRLSVPLVVADHATIPIPARVPDPSRVGPDRLLNAFTAERLYGRPAIVVDFGTATTVDAVDRDGAFAGGAIAPGLQLSARALALGTALLPRVEPEIPIAAIGRDTASAISSGVVYGHVGAVRELIARVAAELGDPDPAASAGHPGSPAAGGRRPVVVATGGLAVAPWMELLRNEVDHVDPHLTLTGLALLHAALALPGVAR